MQSHLDELAAFAHILQRGASGSRHAGVFHGRVSPFAPGQSVHEGIQVIPILAGSFIRSQIASQC
jgi:hypothetical protein